jgi:hypothetical protein
MRSTARSTGSSPAASEGLTLPSSSDARAAAQVGQLAQRLQEAQNAAQGGDPNAVAAALDAYQAEVAAAVRDAGGDPNRLARLEAALGIHLATLESLQGTAPAAAAPAIEAALNASHTAVKQIQAKTPPSPAPRPTK